MHSAASSIPRTVAWLSLCAALAAFAALEGAEHQLDGLVPRADVDAEHTYLLLRTRGEPSETTLEDAAASLDPALPGRCPLAPPPAEAHLWLDAHALSLLPRSSHGALAERLTPPAIRAAIAGARARLSSPLFSVSGEDPRRDPLGLHALAAPTGLLGFLDRDDGPSRAASPEVTARGDLVAADGRSALLCFGTDLPAEALVARARALLTGQPVEVSVVGEAARAASALRGVHEAPRALTTLVAALVLVLALALRRVRSVAALLLATLGPLALLAALVAPIGLLDVALLVLAAGIAAAPARPDRAVAALYAAALVPLALTPYPAWQRWAWCWALGLAAAGLSRRAVQPLLERVLGGEPGERPPLGPEDPPPLQLRSAFPAALTCAALLASATWSLRQERVQPLAPLPLADPTLAAAEAVVHAEFFDPAGVVTLRSPGADAEAALGRAAADAAGLSVLLPDAADRIDAPGAFAVAEPELTLRQESLRALDLRGRIDHLRATIAEFGMRPDAFGEFVRGTAGDLELPPSPASALAGPLGPWLRSTMTDDPAGVAAVTRIYLAPGRRDRLPLLAAEDGRPLDLRGAAAAAHEDRHRFVDRLGLAAAASAWLSALIVWLVTRRFALALALAVVGVAAQCGLLSVLAALGRGFGPAVLPVVMLTGAAAAVAGLRAVRALAAGRPLLDPGRMANALGPLAAAFALLASPEPLWRQFGLAAAIGAIVAHGLGGLAAPGLYSLLERALGRKE